MRILITGGAGFLGSNLCGRLLQDGHGVVCLDNLVSTTRRNIAGFMDHPKFRFLLHDVQEPLGLEVDAIYHLACPASPPRYQADPVATMKTAFLGTMNMLDLAKAREIPILLASTSEVYGDPLVHPQPEDYWGNVNPIGVRSCYDEGKRAAETLASDYNRQYGVDVRIARIFNTYGPGMDPQDGRVVSNFIVQALQNKPLTIYGDGTQTRSFCYVDDLIEGLVRMMIEPVGPGPINLGNPGEFTMLQLAEIVLDLTGSTAGITYRPLPADDPCRRRPNINRAKMVLGWGPVVPLDKGLANTITYFNRTLEGIVKGQA